MDSRIILTQADFSANNIGRYVAFSDFTRKVLTAQTQYNTEDEEAIALNIFLTQLENGGYINCDNPKLRTLIIPALASEHSELLVDIARESSESGNFRGFVNAMNATEQAAPVNDDVEKKLYRVFGLYEDAENHILGLYANYISGYTKNASPAPDNKILTDVFQKDGDNLYKPFTFISYIPVIGNAPVNDYLTSEVNGSIPLLTNSVFKFTYVSSTQYEAAVNLNVAADKYKGLTFLRYNGMDNATPVFELSGDNVSSLGAVTTGSGGNIKINYETNLNKLILAANMKYYGKSPVYSLIAGGDYLTASEVTELQGYINTLMTALHCK